MKERLINNPGLKILSIFLAFFVWLVVMNVSNPEVTRSKEVPLEIENEQVLTNARKAYELQGKSTVTVSYDVRARDEYKIRASDFRAYVDLAELYDVTGSVPVKIEILNNKELLSNAVAKSGTVRIDTEDLLKKRFDLNVVTSGELQEGYAVNEIILNPNYVYLDGPVSTVGQISHIGVELDLTDLEGDTAGKAVPVFYDSNNNKLVLGDKVTVNTPEIDYSISIFRVKNLNLDFEVAGNVSVGYRFAGVESELKSISVQGLKSTLASLNKITIPAAALNIEGATGDQRVTVDLHQYLPEGVTIVGSDGIAEVLLKIERLETRRFVLDNRSLNLIGANDDYQYVMVPDSIELTVQGLSDDLDSLTLEDLGASLDVSAFEVRNTYAMNLTFNQSDVYEVVSYTEAKIIIANKGEEIESETTGEADVDELEDTGIEPAYESTENSSEPVYNETTESSVWSAEGS